MKRLLVFLFSFTCILTVWSQNEMIEVSARVVDANTGEPLPYANIQATQGHGTITNAEGDFTIKVNQNATLKISFVGYETSNISVRKLPQKVSLTPMSNSLGEVRVIPWERILVNASEKLNKEYNKRKGKSSHYFYRMTTSYSRKELVEAFVNARSAVNLRDITFIKGRYGRMTQKGLTRPTIANMNLHHPLELGPFVEGSGFWKGLRTPLVDRMTVSYLTRNYFVNAEELSDSKGNKIYKYNLSNKNPDKQNSILTGTLYIDAESLQLLKFEGQVENMYLDLFQDFYRTTSRILLFVTINYTHKRGYTEVESINYYVKNNDMSSQAILYNIDDLELGLGKKLNKKGGDNMLASIDDAGFDRMLWNNSNIVQRTHDEEILAGIKDRSMVVSDVAETQLVTPTDSLLDHLQRFGRSLPQEKVYVHLDNTSYFVGDTIWFSAYTTQTNDGKPSNISGVLYVELFNHEGFLVERKLIEMTNGRGYANFIIDNEAYAGYYELRAYTRWQLNWGLHQRPHAKISDRWFISKEMQNNYFRDYDKLYSRVFPVYDKPKEKGEYTENMTRKPLRRVYKKDPHQRKRVLALYPEGGELVEGLPNRIAFEATWDDGQQLEGTLNGAKTENRGRGTIEIVPDDKTPKELKFITSDGAEVKADLPEISKSGVVLRVDIDRDTVEFTIQRTNDLIGDTLGLTIMREGMIQQFLPLIGQKQQLRIAKEEFKIGVNQATVFDSQGRVWADRLFFVKDNTTKVANVNFAGVKKSYQPYEPVSFKISTPSRKGGNMSIAVRDASNLNNVYDNSSLMIEMLLTSEIKGFVPNPKFFFEKDDNLHNRALDLLMLTQGWRRFKWKDMAVKGQWVLKHSAERTPIITGRVYKTPDEFFIDDLHRTDNMTEDAENHFAETDGEDRGWDQVENQDQNASEDTYNPWQGNMEELLGSNEMTTEDLSDIVYFPGDYHNPFSKKGLRVHAEWVSLDKSVVSSIDIDTKDGYFKVQLPHYYGNAFFFLSAADTLKWKKNENYNWVQLEEDKFFPPTKLRKHSRVLPAPYQVRVNFPYPRFVKPYNYYQTHLDYSYDPSLSPTVLKDGSLQIDEVNVWGKHNTLRKLEDSIPAFIVDAYEAYNYSLDAGFGRYPVEIARAYVGDYGLKRPYMHNSDNKMGYGIEERLGYDINRRAMNDVTLNPDSAFLRRNLRSFPKWTKVGNTTQLTYNLTPEAIAKYYDLSFLDKYVIYTDYEPRLIGSERYAGSDLPNTQIAIYPFADDSRRVIYRDRRYELPGFSYVNEFYHPDYSKRELNESPEDYRRTLYWNPYLILDEKGEANISFYNNSSTHSINIDAQGFSKDGTILSGYE